MTTSTATATENAEPKPETDNVNHPTHYKQHPSGLEAIEVVESLPFALGNAFKYLFRADHKHDDPAEDHRKAHWYLARWEKQTRGPIGHLRELMFHTQIEISAPKLNQIGDSKADRKEGILEILCRLLIDLHRVSCSERAHATALLDYYEEWLSNYTDWPHSAKKKVP